MTPGQLDEWAADVRSIARKNFEQDGYLQGGAVILSTMNPFTGEDCPPHVIPMSVDDGKIVPEFAEGIRLATKQFKAIAICFFMEAWGVFGEGEEMAPLLNRALKGESVAAMSERREYIMFSFERRGRVLSDVWLAEITRPEGKPVLGEFEKIDQTKSLGTFARLLDSTSVQ